MKTVKKEIEKIRNEMNQDQVLPSLSVHNGNTGCEDKDYRRTAGSQE